MRSWAAEVKTVEKLSESQFSHNSVSCQHESSLVAQEIKQYTFVIKLSLGMELEILSVAAASHLRCISDSGDSGPLSWPPSKTFVWFVCKKEYVHVNELQMITGWVHTHAAH